MRYVTQIWLKFEVSLELKISLTRTDPNNNISTNKLLFSVIFTIQKKKLVRFSRLYFNQ